jgi:hypothetical protein
MPSYTRSVAPQVRATRLSLASSCVSTLSSPRSPGRASSCSHMTMLQIRFGPIGLALSIVPYHVRYTTCEQDECECSTKRASCMHYAISAGLHGLQIPEAVKPNHWLRIPTPSKPAECAPTRYYHDCHLTGAVSMSIAQNCTILDSTEASCRVQ